MRHHNVTRLQVCGKTDVGQQRTHNEDNIALFNKFEVPATGEANRKGNLYIVADGMGGHNAGEVASGIAIDEVSLAYYESAPGNIEDALEAAIQRANERIYRRAQEVAAEKGMGTTLVAAVIRGNELFTAHVGDSRLYLIRDGQIVFVTEDHSFVREQVRNNILTEEEAQKSSMRHVITRSLGNMPEVEVETHRMEIQKGDIVVLCSDGLWEPVGDGQIIETPSQYIWNTPEFACDDLVNSANLAGGPDNISAIVIGVKQVVPVDNVSEIELGSVSDNALGYTDSLSAGRKSSKVRSRFVTIGLMLLGLIIWSLALMAVTNWWVHSKALPTASQLQVAPATAGPDVEGTLVAVVRTATQAAVRQTSWREQATQSAQAAATSVAQMQSEIGGRDAAIAALQKQLNAKREQVDTLKATVSAMAAAIGGTPKATSTPVAIATVTTTPTITVTPVPIIISAQNISQLRQKTKPLGVNPNDWVASIAIARDGKTIAVGQTFVNHNISLPDCFVWQATEQGLRRHTLEGLSNVYSVAFSDDGEELAIGYDRGVAIAKKPFTRTIPLAGSEKRIKSVTYSDHFLAAGGDNGVFVWPQSINNGVANWKRILSEPAASVAFSPDGAQLAIGGDKGALWLCSVSIHNGTLTATGCNQPLTPQVHKGQVWALAFSPDGRWLAAGSQDGSISIWDTNRRKMASKKISLSIVYDLAFFPNGKLLILSTQNGIAAWKFNSGQLKIIQGLPHGLLKPTGSVAITSDSVSLMVGFQGGLELWGLR